MADSDRQMTGLDCSLGLGGEITSWLVCGPIPSHEPGKRAEPFASHEATWGFEHDFLAAMGGEARARPEAGSEVELPDATRVAWEGRLFPGAEIDLKQELVRQDWAIAYLACEIRLPEPSQIAFTVGSRDSLRVWVDGVLRQNFTQRPDEPLRRSAWWQELPAGAHRCLVKVENRCGPWRFRMGMKIPIPQEGPTLPFARLPGTWDRDEVEAMLNGMIARQWGESEDLDSYYGKADVVFRLPTDCGYPLVLGESPVTFRLADAEGQTARTRELSLQAMLDSPRVVSRVAARDLHAPRYRAELAVGSTAHSRNLTLRRMDRLDACPHPFERPDAPTVRERIDELHRESESLYAGGGVWHKDTAIGESFPPAYLSTAYRVRAYCELAQVSDESPFRERAVEGADYLLTEQDGDGCFAWWYAQGVLDRDGHPDSHHVMAVSGYIGIALTEAYALTGRTEYLEGSARAAAWAIRYGLSPNTNYNSFAVEHICSHHRVVPDRSLLNAAVRMTLDGVYPDQQTYGGWTGHNAWEGYHGIVLGGYVALRSVLPDGHLVIPELDRRLTAAANHTQALIQPDGQTISCYDPEEWEKSRSPESAYRHVGELRFGGYSLLSFVAAARHLGLPVEEAIYGLMAAPIQSTASPRDPDGFHLLSLARAYRWLVEMGDRGDIQEWK